MSQHFDGIGKVEIKYILDAFEAMYLLTNNHQKVLPNSVFNYSVVLCSMYTYWWWYGNLSFVFSLLYYSSFRKCSLLFAKLGKICQINIFCHFITDNSRYYLDITGHKKIKKISDWNHRWMLYWYDLLHIQVLKNLTAPFRIPVHPVQDPRSVPYSFALQNASTSCNI